MFIVTICSTQPLLAQHVHADTAQTDSSRLARDTTRVYTLPQVRVTAAPAQRAEAASAVVITPQAIRTAPATNAWDIVRQTAGVEVHQQGQGPGFASDAVIRGFTSDHSTDVALTINGVPVNEPVNGHAEGYANWNEILPEAVSSVRVLKGPTSPWIGNFAMGGEVVVETVPVASGGRWGVTGGSYGDARLAGLIGNVGEGGGYVLAGDAQRQDGWRANSTSQSGHLLFNRVWTRNGTELQLGGWGDASHWNSPGFLTLQQFQRGDLFGAVDFTDGGTSGVGTVRASYKHESGSHTIESMLYARGGDWHIFLNIPPEGGIGEGAPSQTEELDRRLGGGGYTRYAQQLGPRVHLMLGVEYRGVRAGYERYFTTQRQRDSVFMIEDAIPARLNADYLMAAPTVDAHIDVTPKLSLGIGGRYDVLWYASSPKDGGARITQANEVATPKLSAIYRFDPTWSVYAAFNGGFRSADGIISDPTLQPSREWASEVGVRATGHRFEGSIALFNVDVHNEQTFNEVTQEFSANGESRRRGVEIDARVGVVPAVALFTHSTINDAHYTRLISDDGEDLSGVPVFGVARSLVESGVDFQHRGLMGSVWAAYTGPFTPIGEPDARTSPYTLLNARGVVPINATFSLGIGVQNILDRRYTELRASGFVSPGQPRTVLVTLRYGS
ncbi:MAG TPA: TonB-dependent receptor [Gemmatimonadaceae bacterium]|nr:TonB-dependent receptor [Gemmatimonadaceae bacterium]